MPMNSTICASATASGGAIGIIRISGTDAISIANSIFSKDIMDAPANSVIFGNILSEQEATVTEASASSLNGIIDEVLLTIFRAPHSYTGEDSVEISCHGSAYIMQSILQLLCNHGCRMATAGEYTQRAFLNGKMDLSQAEAVADLIASNNAASHRIALQQMRGGISSLLAQLREQLLELTTLLELELDFSEEDVEFADRQKLTTLALDIQNEILRLSNSFSTGNALKNGIPVAIIGAPNVGKSTLLNQLLEDDRAIVSDIQGTTRDIIEDTISINGILFRFIDTAGIRHTNDIIESMGIQRSIKAAEKAQIIIMLTEPGVPFPEIDIRKDQTVIKITNKSEHFQAINGLGIDNLRNKLIKAVPKVSNEYVIITNLRHKEALDRALIDIHRSIDSLQLNLSSDLISEDLRQCLFHLAEITGGQITSDEVLGNIFKNFCIGK